MFRLIVWVKQIHECCIREQKLCQILPVHIFEAFGECLWSDRVEVDRHWGRFGGAFRPMGHISDVVRIIVVVVVVRFNSGRRQRSR